MGVLQERPISRQYLLPPIAFPDRITLPSFTAFQVKVRGLKMKVFDARTILGELKSEDAAKAVCSEMEKKKLNPTAKYNNLRGLIRSMILS
ncbi:protein of unknown function [Legionella micdadei]|uniref:Uncharacterized protein n=1 Tax=Legionella micdadei TaxID=451 RepID=A0A098GHT1_LEGMI|nr:protein of unknown function [Legionella micdadei]